MRQTIELKEEKHDSNNNKKANHSPFYIKAI